MRGIAWDAGYGISDVDVSPDGGRTWYAAELGQDLGRFSFRTWSYRFRPAKAGDYPVMARATNRQGGHADRRAHLQSGGIPQQRDATDRARCRLNRIGEPLR